MGVKHANQLLKNYIKLDQVHVDSEYDIFIDMNIMLFRGAISLNVNSSNPEWNIAKEAVRKTRQELDMLRNNLAVLRSKVDNIYGLCDGVKPTAKLQTQKSRPTQSWRVDIAMKYFQSFMEEYITIKPLVKGEAELEAVRLITKNSIIMSDDTDVMLAAYKYLTRDHTHDVIIYNRRLTCEPLSFFNRIDTARISELSFKIIMCLCKSDYTDLIITPTMAAFILANHSDTEAYKEISKLTILVALYKIQSTLAIGRKLYHLPRSNTTISLRNTKDDFNKYIDGLLWYLNYLDLGCDLPSFYSGTGPSICDPTHFWKYVMMAFDSYKCRCSGGNKEQKIMCVLAAYKEYLQSRRKPWFDELSLPLVGYGAADLDISWNLDGKYEYKTGSSKAQLPVLFHLTPLLKQIDSANCLEFLKFVELHQFPVPTVTVKKL